jgi:PKD repeat protein
VTARFLRIATLAVAMACLLGIWGWASSIDFEPASYNPAVGEAVRLEICSSCLQGDGYVFEWDLDGDGRFETESKELSVMATYETEGYVEITLRAANDQGHRSMCTKAIVVGEVPFLARREMMVESDGAILVVITLNIYESSGGLGIQETIPAGWEVEVVDAGAASPFPQGETLYILWMSDGLPSAVFTITYRLHRGLSFEDPTLYGFASGFPTEAETDAIVIVPICGEVAE